MTHEERIADLKRRDIAIFERPDEPPLVELVNDLYEILPDGSMRLVSCGCGEHD